MFVITTCWGDTDAAFAMPAMNAFCCALNCLAGFANFVSSVMAVLPGQAFLVSGHFTCWVGGGAYSNNNRAW
jgi:hypothetical protein